MNKKIKSFDEILRTFDSIYEDNRPSESDLLLYPRVDEDGNIRIPFCEGHTWIGGSKK